MIKKLLILVSSVLLFVSPLLISQPIDTHVLLKDTTETQVSQVNDFTHTVFTEYATTTWCPNCPPASGGLFKVFESDEYDFDYVTLVSDMNPNARNRSRWGYFNIAIPAVYVDGGYSNRIGSAGNVNATAAIYEDMISESGMRSDVADIDLESTASWNGNAKMTITLTVTNNQNKFYIGFLKSYVTEITSRWDDIDGDPYHYGFLDFAINQLLFLKPGQSKEITVDWDGAADHRGLTFEDITQDNIAIVSAVFNWRPHLETGYESAEYTQRFLAFYVDETTATLPE
jgi:hypothetical protein